MIPSNMQHVEALLYIAGVRVPFSSVNIATSFGAPPRLTANLPAEASLYGIGRNDRVPVHLFIRDNFAYPKKVEALTKDNNTDDYILFFEGEITSFGYMSTNLGKEFSIEAAHVCSFMQDLTVQMTGSLNEYASRHVSGNAEATLQSNTVDFAFPLAFFNYGFQVANDGTNLIKSPKDFLDNVVKFITEEIPGHSKTALKEFYINFAKHINLANRYGVVPYFDDGRADPNGNGFPILNGLQKQTALFQISGLANMASTYTIYDFINFIASYMEYEWMFSNAPIMKENKLLSMLLKPILYDAMPPTSNIIYRSQLLSLTTTEVVHGVPTRIQMKDNTNAVAALSSEDNMVQAEYALTRSYPDISDISATDKENPETSMLLDIEQYTGPFMYQTQGPPWLSYMPSSEAGEGLESLRDRVMKHLYVMKRYEPRVLSVQTIFNPYVSCSYPAVVVDDMSTGFTFLGHVMAVNWVISKEMCSTQLELRFVRSIDDERNNPIESGVKAIEGITSNVTAMSEVYDYLLGSAAIDPVNNYIDILDEQANNNPRAAYKRTYRPICSMTDYLAFMGYTPTTFYKSDFGDKIPLVISGEHLESRYDSGLITTLKNIANKVFKDSIYA